MPRGSKSMSNKKFHLFAWITYGDCGGRYCSPAWAESIAELYASSFSSIEDAQEHFQENCSGKDAAEIITMQDGEMCIVATLDESGITWTLAVKQITNPLPVKEKEPELELIKPVLSKSTARNITIKEQINA